jgi:predicted RNA polymerase sigma factor
LPSVRGDLLERLGRDSEARSEFARAAAMTQNEAERALLGRRAAGTGGARGDTVQGDAGSEPDLPG